MKNKLIITIISMFIITVAAQASVNVKVTPLKEFRTDYPSKYISVRVIEGASLAGYDLREGDILKCDVFDITKPKRGKRNASFSVKPVEYISDGVPIKITDEIYGKYAKTVFSKEELKNMPKGQIVEKAALVVGSHYVKCLSEGVSLAEGMIENEDGNRIKSGVKKVYQDSPVSYIEKGSELDLKPSDEFYFVFNADDNSTANSPNYSYTVPD